MNALVTSQALTMSSLEISQLVESQHTNVKISIERLAKKGVIQLLALQEVEDSQSLSPNSKTKVYNLCKRDSYVVVAQLSPEFTGRLVDRWQELETAVIVPTSFSAALRLAADRQEEVERLEAARLLDAPLIEFAETVSAEAEDIDIATFSKLVTKETGRNLGRNKLLALLRGMGYLASGDVETGLVKNQPYQQYVAQELFTVRYAHDVRGVPHSQTMVTGKGQIRLLSAIRKKLLETGEPSSVIQMADRNQAR